MKVFFSMLIVMVYNLAVLSAFAGLVYTKDISLWWGLLFICFLIGYKNDDDKKSPGMKTLTKAVIKLRRAQRAYMNNRGDQSLGREVGIAAEEVDDVLAALNLETQEETA